MKMAFQGVLRVLGGSEHLITLQSNTLVLPDSTLFMGMGSIIFAEARYGVYR